MILDQVVRKTISRVEGLPRLPEIYRRGKAAGVLRQHWGGSRVVMQLLPRSNSTPLERTAS